MLRHIRRSAILYLCFYFRLIVYSFHILSLRNRKQYNFYLKDSTQTIAVIGGGAAGVFSSIHCAEELSSSKFNNYKVDHISFDSNCILSNDMIINII